MCLGLPMQVIRVERLVASCARYVSTLGTTEGSARSAIEEPLQRISLALVGKQIIGAWLLVHIDAAVRVLDEDEARSIGEALAGLEAALRGEDADAFFPDLAGREPTLPPHLRRST